MFFPKPLLRLLVVILAALPALAVVADAAPTPSPAPAAPSKPVLLPTFNPTIKAVAADSVTVTTGRNAGVKQTRKGPDGKDIEGGPSNVKTYKVDKSSSITLNGLPAALSDLQPNMVVIVRQGTDVNTAESVDANTVPPPLPTPPPTPTPAKGVKVAPPPRKIMTQQVVVAVTPKIITVGNLGSPKARAYYVTPAARITVNDSPGDISAVQVGMEVEIVSNNPTIAESIIAKTAESNYVRPVGTPPKPAKSPSK